MVTSSSTRLGGCHCGSVRFAVTGAPLRVGLCHCKDCRKETGSVAMVYAVWDTAQFSSGGDTASWEGRDFCPRCGTRLYALREDEHEVELRLGSLDKAPTDLVPTEETWVKRREPWLAPVPGAAQYTEDVVVAPAAKKAKAPAAAKRATTVPAKKTAEAPVKTAAKTAVKAAAKAGNERRPVGTGTPVTARKLPRSSGQAGAKKG